MSRTIFTALSPNVQADDVGLALSLIFQPSKWRGGEERMRLEKKFREFLPAKHAYAFTSGRGGLHLILSSLGLASGDEVLLQAYTCVAVPDPVLWNDLKPVYVDIDAATYNMSASDLRKKITARSKVLIIQHTFGFPADVDGLIAVAREHNLFVIEDCAHALGASYKGKNVGTFGDASFFSFGRDKVISSVFGGMVTTNRDDVGAKIAALQDVASPAPRSWIFQQLIHPPITALAKATYDWAGLGKVILKIVQSSRMLSKAVYPIEKTGGQPGFVAWKLPDALAIMALHQFAKLKVLNDHRAAIARAYDELLIKSSLKSLPTKSPDTVPVYLRYTVQSANAAALIANAKRRGIILGDWYTTAIAPPGVRYDIIHYDPAKCPVAEKAAKHTLNLPTGIAITKKAARRIADVILTHEHSN